MITLYTFVNSYASLRYLSRSGSGLWRSLFCYAEKTNITNAERRLRMRISIKCLSRNSRDLFVRLGAMGSGNRLPRLREAGWRGTDIGWRLRNVGEWISARILKRAEDLRCVQGWLMNRAVMLQHPARQHGFACVLNPLVDQNRDFTAQIGGVIQTCQLKTLQRGTRSRVQVVDWWNNACYCQNGLLYGLGV